MVVKAIMQACKPLCKPLWPQHLRRLLVAGVDNGIEKCTDNEAGGNQVVANS